MTFPKIAAVVVAAGRGIRVGGDTPKQYRRVGGQAVLTRTLAALAAHPGITRIQVVIAADAAAFYDECLGDLPPGMRAKLARPVAGGATRQASVRAGIAALAGGDAPELVLVHDAARPFVDEALIDRAIAAAGTHGAAVPGVPVSDTIKVVEPDGRVRETPKREDLRAVQTPQASASRSSPRRMRAPRRRGTTASPTTGRSPNGPACRWRSSPETCATARSPRPPTSSRPTAPFRPPPRATPP